MEDKYLSFLIEPHDFVGEGTYCLHVHSDRTQCHLHIEEHPDKNDKEEWYGKA